MNVNENLCMYILVNQDITINKDTLSAQIGHAIAIMLYNQLKITGKPLHIMEEFMNNYQKKIILYCPQSKLEELEKQGYVTIRDKDNMLICVNLGLIDCNKKLPEEFKFIEKLKLMEE